MQCHVNQTLLKINFFERSVECNILHVFFIIWCFYHLLILILHAVKTTDLLYFIINVNVLHKLCNLDELWIDI